MTKKREPDERDDNAPVAVVDDATERHLVKARQLLREARSRLSSRDDGSIDSQEPHRDDGEDSHD